MPPPIAPDDIVQLEEHVSIHDLPAGPRRPIGRADLSVSRTHASTAGTPGLAILEAPTEVRQPAQDVERVAYLEIRDRRGRERVAVIELPSPSNKRPGEDREQYLARRREPLRSEAHLVEIDLLRGWTPLPPGDRPEGDDSVLVSRADRRPAADFWPIRLRERLPIIPVPLRTPDDDARVDLQEVLRRTYDGPGYEHFIYEGRPDPTLSEDDEEWARRFVPQPT